MASGDEPDGELRQQLVLTGLSYADWELEAIRLLQAAEGSTVGGFVDANNLVRAGEIADAIDEELAMLDQISAGVRGEVGGQVSGVRDRLVALRDRIRAAARRLHGLT